MYGTIRFLYEEGGEIAAKVEICTVVYLIEEMVFITIHIGYYLQ